MPKQLIETKIKFPKKDEPPPKGFQYIASNTTIVITVIQVFIVFG